MNLVEVKTNRYTHIFNVDAIVCVTIDPTQAKAIYVNCGDGDPYILGFDTPEERDDALEVITKSMIHSEYNRKVNTP
jgi:hypothetical protein